MERREEREGDKMEQKEKMQRTEVSELKGSPYMMSAQKEEGVRKCSKFADKLNRFCRQRGGRGSKNNKIMWTSYMEGP